MAENKNKKDITIKLAAQLIQGLDECLQKAIKNNQLPMSTTVDQFIELILANYIQASKFTDSFGALGDGSKILSNLKEKIDDLFNIDDASSNNAYKAMMENFKNLFSDNGNTSEIDSDEAETSKTKEFEKKRKENKKKS